MTDLPTYMWVLVLLGVIGLPAATCAVLFGAARRAGGPITPKRTSTHMYVGRSVMAIPLRCPNTCL